MLDVLHVIESHCLTIRKIPQEVHSMYHIRHLKPHMERVIINGVEYAKETRIPQHAGYWMCQRACHTGATIRWDMRTHNLAPTLEGSIMKYLASTGESNQ